ncbi:MAG: sensor histidine kinase [Acidobacteria bacterium]|nr:sensor histidine kinase [Acidobacteriota bacterium]
MQRAVVLIRPHFSEIRAAWRKKLGESEIGEDAWQALFPLTLEAQEENWMAGNLDEYRRELEQQGQVLERKGVNQAAIAAALGHYLECCLPYLVGSRKGAEPALALARLLPAAQFLTLTSCAAEGAANWRRLQEQERLSFSRDLHDDIGHGLLVLKLYLEMMVVDHKRGDVSQLQSKLEEALALVASSVDSVRRLMFDLGPALLAQFGFLPALKIYARQFTLRTGIHLHLEESNLPENLISSYETALYRVLQGALSNIVKHSQAKHVEVRVGSVKNSVLVMSIEDDGKGFDLSRTPQQAFGLTAMRERIERLGGKVHIESWPARPGSRRHGTRIEVDLPLRGVETPAASARGAAAKDRGK